ncbi:MAG: preprotein translocase subunit SecA [Micavibrio aeruginosavorus]|uniref:Protein translocase subunit SecA n=1 Tax=Micavibrio aeruginosavorus TaxID=349221 RepID=A0A7T5R199_9BACT|nr:MAG: preprotein translocase subunit SecA [Micavibrio aeruginosavorus]
MLLALAQKIFGSSNERTLKSFYRHIAPINALEPQFQTLSDEELRAKTQEFRTRLEKGETLDNLLHEAFAAVREAAKRTLGQRHFDVQLVGGAVLHSGKIAEMRTGEGKTLVATLPTYLNALSGKGVHVVTANDYLAKRDSEWMGQIYKFLGMSVGCIVNGLDDKQRQEAYQADITYGTNNEFGFDYLRDNMKYRMENMAQRPFNYAIVDEVDSILIDEARTPLIISGPSEDSSESYIAVNKIIPHLIESDYEIDEKLRHVTLSESGTEHVENLLRQHGLLTEGNMYDANNITLVHHVNQALRAHKIFAKDRDYIIKDDKVVIIDEFTGRMMEGRRYSEGLHQALEAKEGVKIQNENQTLASITFQNYFRLYPKLAGMTGTAMTEAPEFAEIYRLGVVDIPTNVPVARIDHDDKIFKTLAEKDQAIINQIIACRDRNQPVLVGTVSIEKSETLSAKLTKLKIKHQVLNARHHEQEAYIIAQAGYPGAVTIATNMAGRGTDIQLGGNLDMRVKQEIDPSWPEDKKQTVAAHIRSEIEKNREIVKQAGGLFVIGTERHESRRIDNQLRGRSGRQGDPGASIFFLSLEDDLMRIFGSERMEMLLAHKHIGLKDGEALVHPWISKALERAQAKVEGHNFEIRKNLLKFDNVMNDQRKVIYEQRREIMAANTIEDLVTSMRHEVIENLVSRCIPPRSYPDAWEMGTLKAEIQGTLNLDLPVDQWAKEEGIADEEILERLIDESDKHIALKAAQTGPEMFRKLEKAMVLQQLDSHWKEHLLHLDHLRQGINLRAFAQRDPLNEYKTEAFGMFEQMLAQLRESITKTLSFVEFSINQEAAAQMLAQRAAQAQKMHATRQDPALMGMGVGTVTEPAGTTRNNVQQFPERRAFDKDDPTTWGSTQRNAPCPCGSGKKYKHCHGQL